MKKSICVLYIEFFTPQDIASLEKTLRNLTKKKKFPPFRRITPMVHYKNLTGIRDVKTQINPIMVMPDGDYDELE